MKGVIIGISALALQANSQFNFQINGGGLRVGILGNEVINIGGRNKDQSFSNSFPNDLNIPAPNIPIPNIDIPSPFAPFTAMQITPEINIQPHPNNIQPPQPLGPKPQTPKPQINTKVIQNSVQTSKNQVINPDANALSESKQSDTSEIVQKVVQNVLQLDQQKKQSTKFNQLKQKKQNQQEQIKQDIKNKPVEQSYSQVFKKPEDGKPIIVDVTAEKQKEKQEQSEQIKQFKTKQDQRLAKFIHLMPESQKKHLRAIATQRIPN